MSTEEWRPIPGFRYEVSDLGRVRSLRRKKPRLMKPHPTNIGYSAVSLTDDSGTQRTLTVHRLVAQAFIPADPLRPFVNHRDLDKTNARAANLEWCTHSENMRHAYRSGRLKSTGANLRHGSGSANAGAKLDETSVAIAKQLLAQGVTKVEIAARFNVQPGTIRHIEIGKTWRHVA